MSKPDKKKLDEQAPDEDSSDIGCGELSANPSPGSDTGQAYIAAVRLLSRRDHSQFELTRKLKRRGEHSDIAIESAMIELITANYLNDRRYAGLFAEQRMRRGYGPLSILSKLGERGIDKALAEYAVSTLDTDWVEHAAVVLQRRFSESDLRNRETRQQARIARFLQSRGFYRGDSLKALTQLRKLSNTVADDQAEF
ncbi:MAG: regulatory protein RecX [Granulosicoccus sp.]